MNIGETIDAQNKTITQLQKENEELTKKLISLKSFAENVMQNADGNLIRLHGENEELKNEVQKLRDMLAKSSGRQTPRSGSHIDTGIGHISYSCSGSIDLTELMSELEKVIKNNGVRDTIRILAMAV